MKCGVSLAGLAASGHVRELVLLDRPGAGLGEKAATIASAYDCLVSPVEGDACRDILVGTNVQFDRLAPYVAGGQIHANRFL